jgi:hypothetical protein
MPNSKSKAKSATKQTGAEQESQRAKHANSEMLNQRVKLSKRTAITRQLQKATTTV